MTYRLEDIPIGSVLRSAYQGTLFTVTDHNKHHGVKGDHFNLDWQYLLLSDFNTENWQVVSFGEKRKKGFAKWIQKVEVQ